MLARASDPVPFAIATRQLGLGARGIRKLLGYRISLSAVKHWRAGRRNAPGWALAILDQELAAIESAAGAARKAIAIPPQSYHSTYGLMAYRVHRAAQKEKARS